MRSRGAGFRVVPGEGSDFLMSPVEDGGAGN